jgi:hypothetical protein
MNSSTKKEARLFNLMKNLRGKRSEEEEEELIILSRAVTSGVSYFKNL